MIRAKLRTKWKGVSILTLCFSIKKVNKYLNPNIFLDSVFFASYDYQFCNFAWQIFFKRQKSSKTSLHYDSVEWGNVGVTWDFWANWDNDHLNPDHFFWLDLATWCCQFPELSLNGPSYVFILKTKLCTDFWVYFTSGTGPLVKRYYKHYAWPHTKKNPGSHTAHEALRKGRLHLFSLVRFPCSPTITPRHAGGLLGVRRGQVSPVFRALGGCALCMECPSSHLPSLAASLPGDELSLSFRSLESSSWRLPAGSLLWFFSISAHICFLHGTCCFSLQLVYWQPLPWECETPLFIFASVELKACLAPSTEQIFVKWMTK